MSCNALYRGVSVANVVTSGVKRSRLLGIFKVAAFLVYGVEIGDEALV